MAIEAGPRNTAKAEKKIAVKLLWVKTLRKALNLPEETCQAMSRPAVMKPTLLQVLAGCLIRPGREASQNSAPTLVDAPNQLLKRARKNSTTNAIAMTSVTGNTR